MKIELLIESVVVGLGATMVMDLWSVVLNRAFAVPLPNYCFVGRWLRHMPKGVFSHANIATAPQQSAECVVGWLAHYTLGATFALVFVMLVTPQWLHGPTLAPALIFGLVTVGLPFLVMQPAFGLGIAGSKAANRSQIQLRSLLNHLVFGLGLYLSALALSWL